MCSTYYAALIALSIRFLVASFEAVLPWSECRPEWGPTCIASAKGGLSAVNGTVSSSEFYF